jgi:hypothetical protein
MKITLTISALLMALPTMGQVSVPVLGYFPDGGRIRPAYGIPAASIVARPIDMNGAFSRLAPAMDGFVLAVSAESGEVGVLRPGLKFVPIPGTGTDPEALVLSPRGAGAALWFTSIKRIQTLKGLPDSPAVHNIDVGFLGNDPESLAVSDDGQWVAGVWQDGLHAFGPNGEANWLPIEGSSRRITFLHGTHDMAIATTAGLFRVIDIGGAAELRRVFAGDRPMTPMAVGVSANNRRVVVAEPGGRLSTVELETAAVTVKECACEPEGLFGVGRAVFRLTGLRNRSFLLFDADIGELLAAPLSIEEVEQ